MSTKIIINITESDAGVKFDIKGQADAATTAREIKVGCNLLQKITMITLNHEELLKESACQ